MSRIPARRGLSALLALAAALGMLSAAPALASDAPAAVRAPAAALSDRGVVAGLERYAHPLRATGPDGGSSRDLAALGRMTRGAGIVGVGEVTHGSKEVFTFRERLFRHLVAEEGFTALALEAPWSTGVRLDAHIRTGRGDLRTILREEFQGDYKSWRTEEFFRLFSWMREHNRTSARQLRIMGNDIGDVGRDQYARVLGWTAEHRPALLPGLRERYAGLLALPGGRAERMKAIGTLPRERKQALADDARAAHQLLKGSGAVHPRVLQEAWVIAQMAGMYALDGAALHLHRDRAMAENTVWWQRWTGRKIVAAAHNGHVTYRSPWPEQYPVTQGEWLRRLTGSGYLAIGTSVHSAGYLAAHRESGNVETFDTGPAAPGSNEHTLDRVRHRDYYLDLRRAGRDPGAGGWLNTARPTFLVPATHVPEVMTRPQTLTEGYDVLVHLHRVEAAVPLR
ncbi:erythromycin esterase family protein [Streptomyces sp. CAU 1734]|uniref:erythromycin esterase family protein n=1 Tax=Streptomyces sp. CAU 1734 TaxID=3140360 RepID=UPI0032618384